MIERVVILGLSVALAACSGTGTGTAATNTVMPAATATPPSQAGGSAGGFTPPTTMSRLDYGTRMEKRFRKMDANGDGKVMAAEFPAGRGERQLKRLDANKDGSIESAEWTTGMMARFDRQDVNNDGSLTSDERGKRRNGGGGGRRRDRGAGADEASAGDEDI